MFKSGLAVALAGLLTLNPAALWVASDPPGATVYVDGHATGQTPLRVRLPPGDHRVRLVKDGYLENARVVTVRPHGPTNLQVKLTQDSGAIAAAQGSGSGRPTKWIWIAASGGVAAATGLYLAHRNHPPVGGNVTVMPTAVGMADVTPFSFDSTASDEDGDQLTYAWDFGDGRTGTGKTPIHIYAATGTFSVTLRVTDGKTVPVSATGVSVTVAPNVTGTWVGVGGIPFFPCGTAFAATQNGSALTGFFGFTPGTVGCSAAPPIALTSGSVNPLTHPSSVTWTSDTFAFAFLPSPFVMTDLSVRFTGTTNAAGNSVTGAFKTLQGGVVVVTSSLTFTK